jgi:hypothetical protein
MPRLFYDDEPGVQGIRRGLRRRERDRILSAMYDERRDFDGIELPRREEIELVETLPYRLLHAPGDAKRRQVVRRRWVGEIAGDAQLEVSPAELFRITLAQARRRQLGAQRTLDCRALNSASKARRNSLVTGAGSISTRRVG